MSTLPYTLIRRLSATAVLVTALFAAPAQPAATPQPTEITAQSNVTWSTDTHTYSTFDGNVTITGTNLRLTCDHLEIAATRTGDTTATISRGGQFQRLLATGKVRIIQGDREAHCGRAELLPIENKIILTQNPVVIDRSAVDAGQVEYVGETITIDRAARRITTTSPKITLPELNDLSVPKEKSTPPSAPAQ